MKLFFDTEFTGLHKRTTLISIGIVAENGNSFYAEFTDYDRGQCDEWINENVIKHLYLSENGMHEERIGEKNQPQYYKTTAKGDKEFITRSLSAWLSRFDSVQFISDVCHYDMVLLIDIFGGAFDLPKNVSAVCYDINQDIARHYGISDREAFDKSREDIVSELCGSFIAGDKHNALYDAEVIKAIYEEVK